MVKEVHAEEPHITLDFETRSPCDLRQGAYVYSRHRQTEIMCLAFLLPGDDPDRPTLWHSGYWEYLDEKETWPVEKRERRWIPAGYLKEYLNPTTGEMMKGGTRTLEELYAAIEDGVLVEAHNSFFERCIWTNLAMREVTDPDNMRRGMGAPEVKPEQWRCSAAKAAVFAMPRDLEGACQAMQVPHQKDAEGNALMKRMAKPLKFRKVDRAWHEEHGVTDPEPRYKEDQESLLREFAYCAHDVRSEHALSEALPPLTPFELAVWQADQNANYRGVLIDEDLCGAAIRMSNEVVRRLNRELEELTGIEAGTKRDQVLAWLNEHGCEIQDTQADTLDWWTETYTGDADTRRVLEIIRKVNRTSISKYKRMLLMADTWENLGYDSDLDAVMDGRECDRRVRELVRYYGAATGRWAGSGIQVQNYPRGVLEDPDKGEAPWNVAIEEAVRDVKRGDVDFCEGYYGDTLLLLSSVARGALVAPRGREFLVADYSAIEARVVLWLARVKQALEVFRGGGDIYCDMASGIYRRPITKDDKDERQFGKQAILGLGYGMGYLTFFLTLRKYKIKFTEDQCRKILGDDWEHYERWVYKRLNPSEHDFKKKIKPMPEPLPATDQQTEAYLLEVQEAEESIKHAKMLFKMAVRLAKTDRTRLADKREDPKAVFHELILCKYVVDTYRKRYPEVKDFWEEQENAAIEAIKQPGTPVVCQAGGSLSWCLEGRFLFCYLPSGRRLVYADPYVKEVRTPWGNMRETIRFMGVHKKIKKWLPMGTYGGSIVENIVQGTARDMMAYAVLSVEASETYDLITTIHDEILTEVDKGTGDVGEFEEMMATLPPEFDGCPVIAEGNRFGRYRK